MSQTMPAKKVLSVTELAQAVRAVLLVFEAGSVNTEQRKAIHAVRRLLQDVHGSDCSHENHAYEDVGDQHDVLVCQDCRETLSA